MNPSHSQALHLFVRKLKFLLMARACVQMATVWFFAWGVVVLAVRISGAQHTGWLAFGVLGFVPLAVIAGARALSRQPGFDKVRAAYDQLKTCGGVIMSEEAADMTAWQEQIPAASAPAGKPFYPWLIRKRRQSAAAPVTAPAKSALPNLSGTSVIAPSPAKPTVDESVVDTLRKARERAKRRSDKDQ